MALRQAHVEVNLDYLPKRKNGKIIWAESIGMDIPFVYDEVSGVIKILDYKNNNKILFGYNGKEFWRNSSIITSKSIGNIIGKINRDFLYNIGDIIQTKHSSLKILDRRMGKRKEYYLQCLVCGDESWKTERAIIKYKEYLCGVCAGNKVLIGYNDIVTIAPWMIPLFSRRRRRG